MILQCVKVLNFKKSKEMIKSKITKKYEIMFLLLCFFVTLLSSCKAVSQNLRNEGNSKVEESNSEAQSSNEITDVSTKLDILPSKTECRTTSSLIKFKETSFRCNNLIIDYVEASELPAMPLEEEDHKPDYVKSRNILFSLKNKSTKQHKGTFYETEINIYPIAEFRQSFAKSKKLVEAYDEEIKSLHHIVLEKSVKKEEIPRIPFYDGSPEILTRFKTLSFVNGKGFIYLTQFNVDFYTIIDNEKLVYVFQGITNDNKYYVLATFPVTSKILSEDSFTDTTGNQKLPDYFFDSPKHNLIEGKYRKYLSTIEELLNSQKVNDFEPDLSKIEKMLTSLNVNWNE
jgi:hypothetical protein